MEADKSSPTAGFREHALPPPPQDPKIGSLPFLSPGSAAYPFPLPTSPVTKRTSNTSAKAAPSLVVSGRGHELHSDGGQKSGAGQQQLSLQWALFGLPWQGSSPRSFVRTSLPGKREAPSCTCQSLSRGVSPPRWSLRAVGRRTGRGAAPAAA